MAKARKETAVKGNGGARGGSKAAAGKSSKSSGAAAAEARVSRGGKAARAMRRRAASDSDEPEDEASDEDEASSSEDEDDADESSDPSEEESGAEDAGSPLISDVSSDEGDEAFNTDEESSSTDDDFDGADDSSDGEESSGSSVDAAIRGTKKAAKGGDAALAAAASRGGPKVLLYDGGVARDSDSESESDERFIRNTIGNVPLEWYDDYDHIGYDIEGKRIMRSSAKRDQLDEFLAKMEDPDYWRTVRDDVNDRDVVLTDAELDLVRRIQNRQVVSEEGAFDPHEDYQDWFDWTKESIHPLSNRPEPKRRFIPSKWEHKKVMKIVRAIRKGWIKDKSKEEKKPETYELWDDNLNPTEQGVMTIPAPKVALPVHAESYNPPAEYLFSEEEKKEWEEQDPEDRKLPFIPQKFDALRKVPRYNNFIQERFERCLDLYLCPRVKRVRANVDPDSLIPKLPKPRDLHPFPTTECLRFDGHTDMVRTIAVSPSGQWLVSGSDDGTCRFWEVETGRCLAVHQMGDGGNVQSVAWNPNPATPVVAVAAGASIHFFPAPNMTEAQQEAVTVMMAAARAGSRAAGDEAEGDEAEAPSKRKAGVWAASTIAASGVQVTVVKRIKQVVWHAKGDYVATLAPEANTQAVIIHQLSKARSQNPFSKAKGTVQAIAFHPTEPHFFVATQRFVRVYDLVKQELIKKLISGVKWISSIDIHPLGDNVICGSNDRRLVWFDLDLSVRPYKTIRYHDMALRNVRFHPGRYPLFASASDDATVHIYHGMVYNDLMQNPLIVPVKVLRGHEAKNHLGVLDCCFHPTQPWLFSSGVDSTIRLWTNIA